MANLVAQFKGSRIRYDKASLSQSVTITLDASLHLLDVFLWLYQARIKLIKNVMNVKLPW